MANQEVCKKAVDEWRTNVTKSAIEKNWRKLFFTIDESYTVLHICSDTLNEIEYNMLQSYVLVNLAKLVFGYIYSDAVLYGEYLLRIFTPDNDLPIDLLEVIHRKANDKNEIPIDEIKHYAIKLVSAIINYVYTPY
jgi:hypothetical protein